MEDLIIRNNLNQNSTDTDSDTQSLNNNIKEEFKIVLIIILIILLIFLGFFIYNLIKCYLPKWRKQLIKDDHKELKNANMEFEEL